MDHLFIPAKIKVGFQERNDTYTGKLAYVIYIDNKGKLRKATSWESWRDKNIPEMEVDNTPIDGFVLNKGVGGAKQSYGWNPRNEYIRVHDPRGFEFEISVANLLFILRVTDCSRGKGIEGKCVYSWQGTQLVLLPENSQEYIQNITYTDLQSKTIKVKSLIKGATYTTKQLQDIVYLDYIDCYYTKGPVKEYVFWDPNTDQFIRKPDIRFLAVLKSDIQISNYAQLIQRHYDSPYGSKIVSLFTKPRPKGERPSYTCYYEQVTPTTYRRYDLYRNYYPDKKEVFNHNTNIHLSANGGILTEPSTTHKGKDIPVDQANRLWAVLESGKKYKIAYYFWDNGTPFEDPEEQ